VRHAIGLGLTVTVSHTLGVLTLGVLSLSAASFLPPERLYPVLGLISGAIVIVIGLYLVGARVRDAFRSRAASRAHALAHAGGDDHRHDHGHGTDHGPEQGDSASDSADGWHDHGGRRHRHAPLADAPLSWRGLFALGLAGGMVPSVSALILLLGSISLGRPAYGILLTVAFGLGMALVLVGIGVALVYARGLLERMPVRSSGARLARLLPATTAIVVLGAGVVITGQALLSI
jgi:ABC-type nickel/cobalt efflux system permease component RcnA